MKRPTTSSPSSSTISSGCRRTTFSLLVFLLSLQLLPVSTRAQQQQPFADYNQCIVQLILYDTNFDFFVDQAEFANLVADTEPNCLYADAVTVFNVLSCVCPDNAASTECCDGRMARPKGPSDPYGATLCDTIDALVQSCVDRGGASENNIFDKTDETTGDGVPTVSPVVAEATNNDSTPADDTEDEEKEPDDAIVVAVTPSIQQDKGSASDTKNSSSNNNTDTPTWIWFLVGAIGFAGVVLWIVFFVAMWKRRKDRLHRQRSHYGTHEAYGGSNIKNKKNDHRGTDKDDNVNNHGHKPQDDTELVHDSSSFSSSRSSRHELKDIVSMSSPEQDGILLNDSIDSYNSSHGSGWLTKEIRFDNAKAFTSMGMMHHHQQQQQQQDGILITTTLAGDGLEVSEQQEIEYYVGGGGVGGDNNSPSALCLIGKEDDGSDGEISAVPNEEEELRELEYHVDDGRGGRDKGKDCELEYYDDDKDDNQNLTLEETSGSSDSSSSSPSDSMAPSSGDESETLVSIWMRNWESVTSSGAAISGTASVSSSSASEESATQLSSETPVMSNTWFRKPAPAKPTAAAAAALRSSTPMPHEQRHMVSLSERPLSDDEDVLTVDGAAVDGASSDQHFENIYRLV